MGLFRFLLAFLVVVSHMGIEFRGLNPGVSAVVVFYLMAGQVVSRLWLRQNQLALGQRARWFYRDRCWRILPMYYAMLVLGSAAWWLGGESYFISEPEQPGAWLNNLLIVPLNFYMYNGSDTFTLLPPAWSLAAEVQFYLLVPLLLANYHILRLALLASLAVFTAAQWQLLPIEIFGYRLLAGVGFIFLCGSLLARRDIEGAGERVWPVVILWLAMTCYTVWLMAYPELRRPFNLEVALGFTLGLPAIVLLSRWRPVGAWHHWQRLAGALSYGVFLVHFPVMWLLELYLPSLATSVVAVTALSTLAALAGHLLVEQPLWRRYRTMLERV